MNVALYSGGVALVLHAVGLAVQIWDVTEKKKGKACGAFLFLLSAGELPPSSFADPEGGHGDGTRPQTPLPNPGKSQSSRVSYQCWSGSSGKSQGYTNPAFSVGPESAHVPPAERHLNVWQDKLYLILRQI